MMDGTVLHGQASIGTDGRLRTDLDGERDIAFVTRLGSEITLRRRGETWRLTLPDDAEAAEHEGAADSTLVAPIPGQVTAVHVNPGQAVTRGDVLVVLEAMKTVFRLAAPADGVVAEVSCAAGAMVEEGQVLVRFAESDASPGRLAAS